MVSSELHLMVRILIQSAPSFSRKVEKRVSYQWIYIDKSVGWFLHRLMGIIRAQEWKVGVD